LFFKKERTLNTRNITRVILFGGVIVIALGLTVLAVKAYRAPLGAALESNTAAVLPQSEQPAQPEFVQTDVCGETGAWNVLVLGSDAAELRGPKGSDLTRMLHVDFANKKVTVYAFPRQLWVDTSGLGLTNPTVDAAQLGEVFYEARSRSTKTSLEELLVEGTNATARTLSNNFSVHTDHYVAVDLNQVPAIVDAIGGLPVNVPVAITDPWIGMTIPAGQQTLNGVQVAAYARAIPDSDFERIQRNNLLIAALREKALDPNVWGKIPQLYVQFDEVLGTDLSPEQINHLACLLKEVPADAIIQEQVRQEWTSAGPQAGSLVWDKAAVLNQLKELGLVP
jgi:LCP family protein required for cell wall assembly